MAFVIPTEEAPAPQGQATQQAPVAAGGQGIGGSTKAPSTPGVNLPAQPSAQLSAYLSANQPQAAAFGQNVAGQVGQQINAAGQALQPAVNTYTGGLYTVPTDANVNAAVAASPSSLTADQKATYQAELGAAAKAPNSASTFETTTGYQDAAGKIQSAVEQAGLWNAGNDTSSISTALSPYEGPNATAGVRTLDSLLLSQTPDSYSAIKAATAPAAGFQDQLAAGTQSANDALRAAIAQDQATTPAAQGAASQYVTGMNSTLKQYLADAQAKADQYNSGVGTVSSGLAAIQPQIAGLQDAVAAYNNFLGSPDQYGLDPNATSGTFSPINLASYLAPPGTIGAPSLGQVANPTQYSDLAALQELLGQPGLASLNPSIDQSTASQAGTWKDPGTPTNVSMLTDPMMSSAIQGMIPALDKLLQYSSGGPQGTASAQMQDYLARAFMAAALGTTMVGAPPIGMALGALYGSDVMGDGSGTPTGNVNVQGNSPIGQSVKSIDDAIMALSSAQGKQPWPGYTPPAPAPSGTDYSNGEQYKNFIPGNGTGGTGRAAPVPQEVAQIPGITYNTSGAPIFPQGGSASNQQDVANWTAFYNYSQKSYPGLAIYPPWSSGIHVL